MSLDIIIFAVIAIFLAYRLNAVLGTRNDTDQSRPNPFSTPETPAPRAAVAALPAAQFRPADMTAHIDPAANAEGRVEAGLEEIHAVDPAFNINHFMTGARFAFETIVKAYAEGDRATLKPLLSPKLFADFSSGIHARDTAGHRLHMEIHRILAARIVEAHLGGTMAYITVDYDVEQTSVTRDATGAVVEGSPDRVTAVEDIWTFTRDTRADDPNWILIETRAAEKGEKTG